MENRETSEGLIRAERAELAVRAIELFFDCHPVALENARKQAKRVFLDSLDDYKWHELVDLFANFEEHGYPKATKDWTSREVADDLVENYLDEFLQFTSGREMVEHWWAEWATEERGLYEAEPVEDIPSLEDADIEPSHLGAENIETTD